MSYVWTTQAQAREKRKVCLSECIQSDWEETLRLRIVLPSIFRATRELLRYVSVPFPLLGNIVKYAILLVRVRILELIWRYFGNNLKIVIIIQTVFHLVARFSTLTANTPQFLWSICPLTFSVNCQLNPLIRERALKIVSFCPFCTPTNIIEKCLYMGFQNVFQVRKLQNNSTLWYRYNFQTNKQTWITWENLQM